MAANELRAIFDEDADLYDRARPGYPVELFADVIRLCGLGPGSRVLEIGPGTGQATIGLAARGMSVVGIELGASLAATLQRKAAGLPVQVLVGAFEDHPFEEPAFDAVLAFTAWHWLTPQTRLTRAYAALRPGGSLVTVTTEHVLGGSVGFFADAQRCYERWDPATPPGLRLRPAEEIPPFLDEVDTSDLFSPAVRRRYTQDLSYSTQAYLDLLHTYSGHRALTPTRQAGLMDCLGSLIDSGYGGQITKCYLYEVRVAQRRP